MATVIAQLACYQGCLPQGAPSSPIITNLICSILDMRLLRIAKKYRVDYTRYADDITFSTNDKKFLSNQKQFLIEVIDEINKSGFLINKKKTRLVFQDSRQEVTGLVVNKKVNVSRDYYKKTRAMANALYEQGEFKINDSEGSLQQLEGRFSFINQLDWYNNKIDNKKKHNFHELCSREKQYQIFLFYKYFFANTKPLVVTEGKTDIVYLKEALKKYYKKYPKLISKNEKGFEFKVSFLRKTARLEYFMGIQQDGADTMKNIYNLYSGKNGLPNLCDYFKLKYSLTPSYPVILVFDNEQESNRPLKKFLDYINNKQILRENRYSQVIENVFVSTNPLVKGKKECEIEDLFEDSILSHKIGKKQFSRDKDYDKEQFYGKAIFADYIANHSAELDFSEFKPMLDDINEILDVFKKSPKVGI